jgi:DNA-binding transcriptional MerR regulator
VGRLLTLGELSVRLGLLPHQVKSLADRGLIPYSRAGSGGWHIFRERDVETARRAAEAAGYVHPERAETA